MKSPKIGMNLLLWGVDINPSHIPAFEDIKRAGFDVVEVPVLGQPSADLSKMRSAIESLGLECSTVTFVTADVNPIDPDPAIRSKAVPNLKQRVDECAALGSSLLSGGIYQAHKYFVDRGASEDEWRWSRDCLREVGEYAAEQGVGLGLEFLNRFEVFLINSAADCARMVRDVGLDNVGVLYDTHHANIEDPHPGEALGSVQSVLSHVHLSESHRGTLGTGQVDWAGTFDALHAIDYSGWLVVEAFGTDDPTLVAAANVWRNAFDTKEQLTTDAAKFIQSSIAGLGDL